MVGRPGIKEVAAASGVSIKTVSRVVNDESSVRPATRSRVRAAIDELGYIPNTAARSLKSGTGRVIGIVIDSLADPFFAALVSAIERRALGEGLGIVVASTGQDVDREREQLLLLLSGHRAAGVIFAPVTDSHPYLQSYRESTPIVAVDRAHPDFDSVVVDDFEATRTAIRQLVNDGHRRIAFLYREQRYGAISRRYSGYLWVLTESGIPFDPELVLYDRSGGHDFTDEDYVTEINRLFSLETPPTALFAANMRAAVGIIGALHQARRAGTAMIAFGNVPLAGAFTPAISCINQDPYAIGNAAIERLLALRSTPGESREKPRELVIPTSLIRRGSGEIFGPYRSSRSGEKPTS